MKKPDRNVSIADAYNILKQIRMGFLSMIDAQGLPYGTPVNAVFCEAENCLYFHCSRQGRRWDALHINPSVNFVAILDHNIIGSRFITHYQSVMVQGEAHFIEDPHEKKRTLILMTELLAPGELSQRPQVIDTYFEDVAMVKISIDSITAKINCDS